MQQRYVAVWCSVYLRLNISNNGIQSKQGSENVTQHGILIIVFLKISTFRAKSTNETYAGNIAESWEIAALTIREEWWIPCHSSRFPEWTSCGCQVWQWDSTGTDTSHSNSLHKSAEKSESFGDRCSKSIATISARVAVILYASLEITSSASQRDADFPVSIVLCCCVAAWVPRDFWGVCIRLGGAHQSHQEEAKYWNWDWNGGEPAIHTGILRKRSMRAPCAFWDVSFLVWREHWCDSWSVELEAISVYFRMSIWCDGISALQRRYSLPLRRTIPREKSGACFTCSSKYFCIWEKSIKVLNYRIYVPSPTAFCSAFFLVAVAILSLGMESPLR